MQNHLNRIAQLNGYKTDILKFHSLKDVELQPLREHKYDFKNEGNKLCVVYCVWANTGYVKFLYFSLLSQLLHTDITRYDLRIFVSEDFYQFVVELFSPILDNSKIIKTPNGMSFKYGISVHPELQKYKVVTFTDTDAFVFSKNKNVYSKIYQFHKQNPNVILMCDDKGQALETYEARQKALTQFNNLSLEEYNDHFKKWFRNGYPKIQDYLETKKWYLSCHFSYSTKIFDNFKFSSYICDTLYKQFGCDETVWLMYILANNYKVLRISPRTSYKWIGSLEYLEFVKNIDFNQDLFIHPATGEYCKNDDIKLIYEKILEDYNDLK